MYAAVPRPDLITIWFNSGIIRFRYILHSLLDGSGQSVDFIRVTSVLTNVETVATSSVDWNAGYAFSFFAPVNVGFGFPRASISTLIDGIDSSVRFQTSHCGLIPLSYWTSGSSVNRIRLAPRLDVCKGDWKELHILKENLLRPCLVGLSVERYNRDYRVLFTELSVQYSSVADGFPQAKGRFSSLAVNKYIDLRTLSKTFWCFLSSFCIRVTICWYRFPCRLSYFSANLARKSFLMLVCFHRHTR